LVDEKKLNKQQQQFVKTFFEEEVRSNIIPLMIESLPQLPYLREKSIYLGVVMRKEGTAYNQKYALDRSAQPRGWPLYTIAGTRGSTTYNFARRHHSIQSSLYIFLFRLHKI
jgi:hypothetical protein